MTFALFHMQTLYLKLSARQSVILLLGFFGNQISQVSLQRRPQVLTSHMNRFSGLLAENFAGGFELRSFTGALDLVTHQNPRMHILELDDSNCNRLGELLDVTGVGISPRRFESYTKGSMTPDGVLLGYRVQNYSKFAEEVIEPRRLEPGVVFDAVIVPPVSSSRTYKNEAY